jgi:hypothetical protein
LSGTTLPILTLCLWEKSVSTSIDSTNVADLGTICHATSWDDRVTKWPSSKKEHLIITRSIQWCHYCRNF